MNNKQRIFIFALPILFITMLGTFQLFGILFESQIFEGHEVAWWLGFFVYWPLYCVLFPVMILGKKEFRTLFAHKRLGFLGLLFLLFPPIIVFIGRFIMEYDQAGTLGRIILVFHAFGNGILEEILWRGVSIKLFPDSKVWGVYWPSLWFGIWHLAPGSVSTTFSPWALMAGAVVFGLSWGMLAMKTKTIRWSIVSHTLTGLARVLG